MTRRPRLTDQQKDRIRELREAGRSLGFIARRVSCSEGAASWYCLLNAIESPRTARNTRTVSQPAIVERGGFIVRFSADEDEELLRLEAQGTRLSEIARALGRKRNTVLGRLATLARRDARLEAAQA